MSTEEIFSFHLAHLPLAKIPRFFMARQKKVPGLNHSERFFTMNLGAPIFSAPRYNLTTVAYFAWWQDEKFLASYLQSPANKFLVEGWHVRMRLYRRWGCVSEIRNATVNSELAHPESPVVAVTLARLKLTETFRFIKWGRPVESQVRDHDGIKLALAAMRPLNTFSTFSVWENEAQMVSMVQGRDPAHDGTSHVRAMAERQRRDFHHEFTTMRFVPYAEMGSWNGKSSISFLTNG